MAIPGITLHVPGFTVIDSDDPIQCEPVSPAVAAQQFGKQSWGIRHIYFLIAD